MMYQDHIRRIAVQSAAYQLRVHAERDYVDMDTAQDVANRTNEILRETYLYQLMVDYDDVTADDVVEILDIDL